MITFTYTARDLKSGENVSAEVQAENQQAAAKLLISQNLFPITIKDKSSASPLDKLNFLNRVRSRDLVIFTRQLSTLINAGLPLVQSLRNVLNQVSNKKLKETVVDVITTVEGGTTFSEALRRHQDIFDDVYVYLVAAGETSGTLDKVLERLADQQEKDAAIVRKIRGAMIYPAIVFVVLIGVVIFLLVTLLPQVAGLYTSLNRSLPPLTRALVAISTFIVKFWYIVVIVAGLGGFALIRYLKTLPGQRVMDKIKLNVPVFSVLFRKVYMARFARTMSTLLSSGIPMLEGMSVTQKAIKNLYVFDAISRAADKVKGGKSLSSSLEVEAVFIPLVPQMIAIGEQSGALDDMLLKVATFYEGDVDEAVENLATTIEPVMMVVMGVVVGLVIAAVLLPIYGLVGGGSTAGLGG